MRGRGIFSLRPKNWRINRMSDYQKILKMFSAPETANQLAWGYVHMIEHYLLSNGKEAIGITPQSKLIDIAGYALKNDIHEDLTSWNLHPTNDAKIDDKVFKKCFDEWVPEEVTWPEDVDKDDIYAWCRNVLNMYLLEVCKGE